MVIGNRILVVRYKVGKIVMRRRRRRRPIARVDATIGQRPLALAHAAVRAVLAPIRKLLARGAGVRVCTRAVVDGAGVARARVAAAGQLIAGWLRRGQRRYAATAQISTTTELRF